MFVCEDCCSILTCCFYFNVNAVDIQYRLMYVVICTDYSRCTVALQLYSMSVCKIMHRVCIKCAMLLIEVI